MMKKVTIKVFDKNINDPIIMYCNTHKNRMYECTEGKYFFNSDYEPRCEIEIEIEIIQLDEELFQILSNNISICINESRYISEEYIEEKIDTILEVKSIIHSAIQSSSYSENPVCIFDFITKIISGIITSHKLFEGNKRFTLMYLIYLCNFFGLRLHWSTGNSKNYKNHETQIKTFVENQEKDFSHNKQETFNEVKKWIYRTTLIKFPI